MAEDISNCSEQWKYAFSSEGRSFWKPEFTLRYRGGIHTDGPVISAGIRIDDKRTLGFMVGQGDTYIDAAPGDIMHITTALYNRRYFHVGHGNFIAFYSDLSIGTEWIYEVRGKYRYGSDGEIIQQAIEEDKGDIGFYFSWEPGIRFRLFKNVHLFFGPAISANTLGLHFGIGL